MTTKKLIYYVAQSVDGYIADKNGSVDWLNSFEESSKDYGYQSFYDGIDSLVMGSQTYQFILDYGKWIYPKNPCWVFSKRQLDKIDPLVQFSSDPPLQVLQQIRKKGYSNTWLVGGAQLANSFFEINAITDYIIHVMPVVLGEGIPLLSAPATRSDLELTEKNTFPSGAVQLIYNNKIAE